MATLGDIQAGGNALVIKQEKYNLIISLQSRQFKVLWKKREIRLLVEKDRRSIFKERKRERSQTAINLYTGRRARFPVVSHSQTGFNSNFRSH